MIYHDYTRLQRDACAFDIKYIKPLNKAKSFMNFIF
jgi:hypothetical protein